MYASANTMMCSLVLVKAVAISHSSVSLPPANGARGSMLHPKSTFGSRSLPISRSPIHSDTAAC